MRAVNSQRSHLSLVILLIVGDALRLPAKGRCFESFIPIDTQTWACLQGLVPKFKVLLNEKPKETVKSM